MKKKCFTVFRAAVCLILGLMLCAGVAAPVYANDGLLSGEADPPSSWAVSQVDAAISAGLVPENLQSQFTTPITRAEFAALAVAFYEVVTGREIAQRLTFNDTSDINVQKMGGLGVVTGVGGGYFAPNDTLTRQQAAVIIVRLAEAVGQPFPTPSTPLAFSDNAQISLWAITAVGQVRDMGIMGGTGGNMFSPGGYYTREQAIVTMMRTFEIVSQPLDNPLPEPIEFVLEHHSRNIWLPNEWGQRTYAVVRNTDDILTFGGTLTFSWANVRDYFMEITSDFDDAFFEERMLLFVYLETSTGMAIVRVDGISLDEHNILHADIAVEIPDGPVTADIGNHFLIISIPQMDVAGDLGLERY